MSALRILFPAAAAAVLIALATPLASAQAEAPLPGTQVASATSPADSARPSVSPADSPSAKPTTVPPPPARPHQVLAGHTADGLPVYRLAPGVQPSRVGHLRAMFVAEYRFSWQGHDRSFRVFVPRGLAGPAPTILALHGLYHSSLKAQNLMRFQDLATTGHFVVAYPQGEWSSWNAGRCCGADAARQVDDVSFLTQVQRYLGSLYPTDPHRRYLTGFSNGGMMAARVACSSPSQWAAVAIVAATHVATCRPSRVSPVPFLDIHGLTDRTVPVKGEAYSAWLGCALPSVAWTDALWAGAGGPVKTVLVAHAGHEWPTASGASHYDTTAAVWSFFSQYAK